MPWTVVVPVKALPEAKSRLVGFSAEAHALLVRAIRADTLAAARSARNVARLMIVADRPDAEPETGDTLLVQSEPGLNAALRQAEAVARLRWPEDSVAALVGDLPALRSEELAEALDRAAQCPRGFVADIHGTGTTLLTALAGVSLDPAFGAGSAARHAKAFRLPAGPGLRHDVDTAADLDQALAVGAGPATRAVTSTHALRTPLSSA